MLPLLLADQIGLTNSAGRSSAGFDAASAYWTREKRASQIFLSCVSETKEALPGIVCWGDAAAVGNGHETLPGRVYALLNRGLFSALEDAFASRADYHNVQGLYTPVVNMGAVKEGMNELLARCGARPILLAEDFSIPLYGEKKRIELMDGMGNALRFAEQTYAKFNKISIQGVTGYLYTGAGGYDKDHPYLTFVREFSGSGLFVPMGAPVETESAAAYRQYLPILYFQSTLGKTEEEFVQCLTMMLNQHENPGGYGAVIVCAEEASGLDEALKEAFGERYIRVQKTAEDMRDTDYEELARAVLDCLDRQGALDGVREAVQESLGQIEAFSENGGAA